MAADFDPAQHFDDDLAAAYDGMIRLAIPGYEALHEMAYALLRHLLPAAASVFVVGAGTGQELVAYGAANPDWSLTGVDVSASMLAVASGRLQEAGLEDRIRLIHGEVTAVELERPCDAATALLVMHFLPDDGAKERLLRAMYERLAPGGYLLLADLTGCPGDPAFERLFAAWGQHMVDRGGDVEEVSQRLDHVRRDVCCIPEPRLVELLDGVGFSPPQRFYTAFLFNGWLTQKSAHE
ncbi:MAG: class I SAM-dependent methyltransferase [Nitrospirota bacterium]|jgi:tRNA (cmo5U34)-methyltransferase